VHRPSDGIRQAVGTSKYQQVEVKLAPLQPYPTCTFDSAAE
jgi:hypothetical protein